MRDELTKDLSTVIPSSLAEDLVRTYEKLVSKFQAGENEEALTQGGRFVEHTFRAIEHIRTGTAPAEIKSVKTTMAHIEQDASLDDALRFLIPRAAYGLIYNIRSKRNAVHVKQVDPTGIDAALLANGAGWILAEFVRLYHHGEESKVAQVMLALTRSMLPFVESIGDETFVSKKVPAEKELLMLLAHAKPGGLSRTQLGASAKCSPSSVTKSLDKLCAGRLVHKSASSLFHITNSGEQELTSWLTDSRT